LFSIKVSEYPTPRCTYLRAEHISVAWNFAVPQRVGFAFPFSCATTQSMTDARLEMATQTMTALELELTEALEKIEGVLNKEHTDPANEQPFIKKIRTVIEAALFQVTCTSDTRRGFPAKQAH
jgi:hypothetical protein